MISEIKKKEYPKKTIEIHLKYSPKVYKVSGKEYRLYDQSPERKWQHLSWFDYTCFIACGLPRYVDDNGKVKVMAVSFASKGKGYTRLFSQKIIASLLLVKVQKTVATLFQTTPRIVSSIMEKAVENGLDERGEITDFEHVSIDEKAYRKGHQYASILIDSDKDYVMKLGEGRAEKDVKALFFSLNFQEEQPQLKSVTMAMWKPFMNTIKDIAPQPLIIHDKFHLFKTLSEAIAKPRRKEVLKNPLLKKHKYS